MAKGYGKMGTQCGEESRKNKGVGKEKVGKKEENEISSTVNRKCPKGLGKPSERTKKRGNHGGHIQEATVKSKVYSLISMENQIT